jgi:hypothetical protein
VGAACGFCGNVLASLTGAFHTPSVIQQEAAIASPVFRKTAFFIPITLDVRE